MGDFIVWGMSIRWIGDALAFLSSFCIYLFQITLPWSLLSIVSLGVLRVRWQILGAYAAAVLYSAGDLLCIYFETPLAKTIVSYFCATLILGTFLINVAFPLFSLPKPSGQYAVGTKLSSWYDSNRDRRLAVQIWYPSEAQPKESQEPLSFWWPNSTTMGSALCSLFQVPFFLLLHLDHCKSNTYLELPIVNQTLPIIIFCHGFYGFKGDRSYFSEQFASNGYIVLGIDHPGDCAICLFPNGDKIPFSAYLKPGDDEFIVRNAGLKDRVEDIDFIMDRLLSIHQNNDSFDPIERVLANHMDFQQIGLFGHSYGSATCVQFLQKGRNVQYVTAVVGLDVWVFPLHEESVNGVQKPLLFISSDSWAAGNKYKSKRQDIISNSCKESVGLIVKGTNHHNFDDMPFIVHRRLAKWLGFIGDIPPMKCFTLTSEFALSYFDTYARRIKTSQLFPTTDLIYEEARGTNTK